MPGRDMPGEDPETARNYWHQQTGLQVCKANSLGHPDMVVPDCVIEIAGEIGEERRNPDEPFQDWHRRACGRYAIPAKGLERMLFYHLPGGTYDALFYEMCLRKASLFIVPHVEPTPEAEDESEAQTKRRAEMKGRKSADGGTL